MRASWANYVKSSSAERGINDLDLDPFVLERWPGSSKIRTDVSAGGAKVAPPVWLNTGRSVRPTDRNTRERGGGLVENICHGPLPLPQPSNERSAVASRYMVSSYATSNGISLSLDESTAIRSKRNTSRFDALTLSSVPPSKFPSKFTLLLLLLSAPIWMFCRVAVLAFRLIVVDDWLGRTWWLG